MKRMNVSWRNFSHAAKDLKKQLITSSSESICDSRQWGLVLISLSPRQIAMARLDLATVLRKDCSAPRTVGNRDMTTYAFLINSQTNLVRSFRTGPSVVARW